MLDFREHLARQLSFLKRSCQAYDEGYLDESIRIATCIRVLLHNTGRSISLLAHMGAMSIKLMTSCGPVGEHVLLFMGLGEWNLMGPTMAFRPSKPSTFESPPLPAQEWWQQTVFVLMDGTRITRKDIALAAANKDGGAHVDPKLTSEYEAISKPGAQFAFYHRSESVSLGLGGAVIESAVDDSSVQAVVGVPDTHLVSLRQMGHELLHSPELLALA